MNGSPRAFPGRKSSSHPRQPQHHKKKRKHWLKGPTQSAIFIHGRQAVLAQSGRRSGFLRSCQGQSLSGPPFPPPQKSQLQGNIDVYVKKRVQKTIKAEAFGLDKKKKGPPTGRSESPYHSALIRVLAAITVEAGLVGSVRTRPRPARFYGWLT